MFLSDITQKIKQASVAKDFLPTDKTEVIEKQIQAKAGDLILARVLENKSVYNTLELTTGRFSVIKKMDLVILALGKRRALQGFVGDVPETVQKGDILHLLNLGGVAGKCSSTNEKEVGKPLEIEVLGSLGEGQKVFNIQDFCPVKPSKKLELEAGIILITGTSMNSGKTTVCANLINSLAVDGFRVVGVKPVGVGCLKDTEKMKDYGAIQGFSMVDCGLSSSIDLGQELVYRTFGILNKSQEFNPDFVVMELGDGLLGQYGVADIMKNPEIQKKVVMHIGCGSDPAGACMIANLSQQWGLKMDIISGPVTDNSVGKNFIEKELKLKAMNASQMGDSFYEKSGLGE